MTVGGMFLGRQICCLGSQNRKQGSFGYNALIVNRGIQRFHVERRWRIEGADIGRRVTTKLEIAGRVG